jgi:hypothetical protein
LSLTGPKGRVADAEVLECADQDDCPERAGQAGGHGLKPEPPLLHDGVQRSDNLGLGDFLALGRGLEAHHLLPDRNHADSAPKAVLLNQAPPLKMTEGTFRADCARNVFPGTMVIA